MRVSEPLSCHIPWGPLWSFMVHFNFSPKPKATISSQSLCTSANDQPMTISGASSWRRHGRQGTHNHAAIAEAWDLGSLLGLSG